jgi:cytochrome c oxidase assembly factor 3
MSPGLKRAREQYRVKNALLGVAIFGVAGGIWAWSISAVKQDTFEDLDEEARALARPATATGAKDAAGLSAPLTSGVPMTPGGGASSTIVTGGANMTSLQTGATPLGVVAAVKDHAQSVTTSIQRQPRGLLAPLLARFLPAALDPNSRTLVWGAPTVDSVGKLGERRT